MTQATHTPGPWSWDYYASGYVLVGAPPAHSSVRQQVFLQHGTPDGDLIAAAPDMLAALESILDLSPHDDGCREITPESGIMDDIRAAIAKARGEG